MPPRPGRGDLLQVLRPEQPTQSVREEYIHDHVPISPVTVRDPAHHAAALGDPITLAHPYARTDSNSFWLHEAASIVSGRLREKGEHLAPKKHEFEHDVKLDVETRVRQGVKDVLEEVLQEEMSQHLQAGYRELTPTPGRESATATTHAIS